MAIVVKGKDRGKKGAIMKVLSSKHQVILEGINIRKKHVRPSKKNMQGGIIDINHPLPVSNIRLICPETGKPTRVGIKITKNGQRERFAKVSSAPIDAAK